MGRLNLYLFLLFFGGSFTSFGQTCPPNIDFELGNTSFWRFYTGNCCPIVTPAATPPLLNRHTLTTGSAVDPYGFFPVVAPGSGSYSLRLGNDIIGHEAEKARYYVHIPAGNSEYSLIYRYAVVLEDPSSHTAFQKPRFDVNVFDSVTGDPVSCAQFSYVASAALPGFALSSVPSSISSLFDIIYKPWATATINLSGLAGRTIAVDFASGDCLIGGHFGYGYVDMTCGLFAISNSICNDPLTVLSAPEGFATYTWYDSLTFTAMGSGQSITFPSPVTPTTYAVVIQPYPGFGCSDTLYTRVIPYHLTVSAWGDTAVCLGKYALIGAVATDIAIPLTYRWSPAASLTCSNCATTIAYIPGTTVYTVTVTNSLGCSKSDTVRVSELITPPGVLTYTNVSCYGYSDGNAIVTPPAGAYPCTYAWSTMPVQTDSFADHLVAGTYTVSVVNAEGCKGDGVVTIAEPPPTVLSIIDSTDPVTCLGAEGSITLDGLVPITTYTVSYLHNGIPRTAVLTASATGIIVMTGLPAGIYSNITIIGTLCPYNIVGPVVLSDPPNPVLPGVGSNSPVCEGSTLILLSACVTPGVTYSWTGPGGFTSTLQNPTPISPAAFSDAGLYTVTVMVNNCFSSDTTRVAIKPVPSLTATNNSPLCSGDSLKINSSASIAGAYFSWRGPDAFISNLQNPVLGNASTAASGIYSLTATLDGCSNTITTNVVVKPTPDTPAASDVIYCQFNSPTPLTATGTGLLWYTAATGGIGSPIAPLPSTLVAGTFIFYVSQETGGCTSPRKSVKVSVYKLAGNDLILTDTTICVGNYVSMTAVNAFSTDDDYDGITWYFGYGDSLKNVNPVAHSFDSVGSFRISAQVYHEVCPDITLIKTIRVSPYPVLHLGPDTSLCPGASPIVLIDNNNAGNAHASWYWSSGHNGPKISVNTPGLYYTTVLINGCATADTVLISNDCYVDIPNVFSPNGDNINDYFFPRQFLIKGLTSFKMNIFNRWGQLIFTSSSIDGRGWDGKFNNILQPEGVYVYTIDAGYKNGKSARLKGNVTLLR